MNEFQFSLDRVDKIKRVERRAVRLFYVEREADFIAAGLRHITEKFGASAVTAADILLTKENAFAESLSVVADVNLAIPFIGDFLFKSRTVKIHDLCAEQCGDLEKTSVLVERVRLTARIRTEKDARKKRERRSDPQCVSVRKRTTEIVRSPY